MEIVNYRLKTIVPQNNDLLSGCLLYTSDAADDMQCVDLGGRRIIKKNFFKQKTAYEISECLVGSEMCIRDREICAATGTDGMIDEPQRKKYTAKQREAQRYAEALHGTLSGKSTVRKILAIREQIGNL